MSKSSACYIRFKILKNYLNTASSIDANLFFSIKTVVDLPFDELIDNILLYQPDITPFILQLLPEDYIQTRNITESTFSK